MDSLISWLPHEVEVAVAVAVLRCFGCCRMCVFGTPRLRGISPCRIGKEMVYDAIPTEGCVLEEIEEWCGQCSFIVNYAVFCAELMLCDLRSCHSLEYNTAIR